MLPHPTAKFSARFQACLPSGASVRGARGFTLIELLTVIALIGILAALALGVMHDVSRRAAFSRTKAELAVLAQALEAYRRHHGDYPQTADRAQFYAALCGRLGPTGAALNERAFVETGAFTLSTADPGAVGTHLLDPWGRPYLYAYKSQAPWTNPGYILYSAGPDGQDSPALLAGGVPDYGAVGNADNLYAGRD